MVEIFKCKMQNYETTRRKQRRVLQDTILGYDFFASDPKGIGNKTKN
jgi:hypothetical protein